MRAAIALGCMLVAARALPGCSTDTFGSDASPDVALDTQDETPIPPEASGGDAVSTEGGTCDFDGVVVQPCGKCAALGSVCCIDKDAGTGGCNAMCNGGDEISWGCFRPGDCLASLLDSGVLYCCLDNVVTAGGCPRSVVSTSGSACETSCTGRKLCVKGADCASGTCETYVYGTVVVGLCAGAG